MASEVQSNIGVFNERNKVKVAKTSGNISFEGASYGGKAVYDLSNSAAPDPNNFFQQLFQKGMNVDFKA